MEGRSIRALSWEVKEGLHQREAAERALWALLPSLLPAGSAVALELGNSSEPHLFHKLGAEPAESCFFRGLCFLSWKTKVEGDNPQSSCLFGLCSDSNFSLQSLYCRTVFWVLVFAGSALWLSLFKTDLCPTIDLKNKAKQQLAAFLINSANNRGSLGRGCSPVVWWNWALLQGVGLTDALGAFDAPSIYLQQFGFPHFWHCLGPPGVLSDWGPYQLLGRRPFKGTSHHSGLSFLWNLFQSSSFFQGVCCFYTFNYFFYVSLF